MELLLSYYKCMNRQDNLRQCEKIYNTCVVLDTYCKCNTKLEEIQIITPIVEYIRKQADKLYSDLSGWQ